MTNPNAYQVVTARSLARNTSKLLDDVQASAGLLITRHGVPVAILTSVARPSARSAPDADVTVRGKDANPAEAGGAATHLEPNEREVLAALVRPLLPDTVADQTGHSGSDVMKVLTGLELKGLAQREFPGVYRLTDAGRVALALDGGDRGRLGGHPR
jgi:antitoxin (DNA-binding transcriptional repressor) of toxin-antitoxin stability system